jgi:hypothetical protein
MALLFLCLHFSYFSFRGQKKNESPNFWMFCFFLLWLRACWTPHLAMHTWAFFTSTLHYMNHVPNMGPKFVRAPGRRPSCPRPEPALPAVASTVASCSRSSGGVLAVIFSLWCIYGVVGGWNLGRRPRLSTAAVFVVMCTTRQSDLEMVMAFRGRWRYGMFPPSLDPSSVLIRLIRCCAWRLLADAPSHACRR